MSKTRLSQIILFLSLHSAYAYSALPEISVPFEDTIVPPHRTLTAFYYNASRFNYVSCYCISPNSPIVVTWKYKHETRTKILNGWEAFDTYNANHRGKLHFYNNSDRTDIKIHCYQEYDTNRGDH